MKELNIFEATALTSPNPLTLICSENEDGTTNLAPICFVSYLSFNPPMIGFATGKQAHTGERVRETGKVILLYRVKLSLRLSCLVVLPLEAR